MESHFCYLFTHKEQRASKLVSQMRSLQDVEERTDVILYDSQLIGVKCCLRCAFAMLVLSAFCWQVLVAEHVTYVLS